MHTLDKGEIRKSATNPVMMRHSVVCLNLTAADPLKINDSSDVHLESIHRPTGGNMGTSPLHLHDKHDRLSRTDAVRRAANHRKIAGLQC